VPAALVAAFGAANFGFRPKAEVRSTAALRQEPTFIGGALGGTAAEPTIRTPHVLSDGADSMGLLMANARRVRQRRNDVGDVD
jgi:hypothetical protein